jgi:hypothetical protein
MITKEDLPEYAPDNRILRCDKCLSEYSANRSDYPTKLLDEPFVCCGKSVGIYMKKVVFESFLLPKRYRIVGNTHYSAHTPFEVVVLLESLRTSTKRITVFYGDIATGLSWGDKVSGTIGRSSGEVKVPISLGGEGILDDCIVKITESSGGGVLYQHEKYHTRGDF